MRTSDRAAPGGLYVFRFGLRTAARAGAALGNGNREAVVLGVTDTGRNVHADVALCTLQCTASQRCCAVEVAAIGFKHVEQGQLLAVCGGLGDRARGVHRSGS